LQAERTTIRNVTFRVLFYRYVGLCSFCRVATDIPIRMLPFGNTADTESDKTFGKVDKNWRRLANQGTCFVTSAEGLSQHLGHCFFPCKEFSAVRTICKLSCGKENYTI
jgi:hypothetical protein